LRDQGAPRSHRGRFGARRITGTDGMSATRDPDPIVRAWLDLMPDEAPDRVVDAIRDAIELTPQAAAGRLGRRRLPSLARYLAVAAGPVGGAGGGEDVVAWAAR